MEGLKFDGCFCIFRNRRWKNRHQKNSCARRGYKFPTIIFTSIHSCTLTKHSHFNTHIDHFHQSQKSQRRVIFRDRGSNPSQKGWLLRLFQLFLFLFVIISFFLTLCRDPSQLFLSFQCGWRYHHSRWKNVYSNSLPYSSIFLSVSDQDRSIGFLRSKAKSKHFVMEDVPQETAERDRSFYFKVYKRSSHGEWLKYFQIEDHAIAKTYRRKETEIFDIYCYLTNDLNLCPVLAKEGDHSETILQNLKTQLYLSRSLGLFLFYHLYIRSLTFFPISIDSDRQTRETGAGYTLLFESLFHRDGYWIYL